MLLKPFLDRTRSRGRCWAAIQLSHHPEPSGHAVHGEVDGLDVGGQHGRLFVLLRHTHRPQKGTIPHLFKKERKRPTPVRRRLSRNQALLGRVIPGGGRRCRWWKCWVWWSCPSTPHSVGNLPTAPHVCCCCQMMRCCVAGTNGGLDFRRRALALDGRVRQVEQMSRFHGTACYRQCDSNATKLSRLDACEDWKVVLWCRTQASSHNSQGIVDDGVDEAGIGSRKSPVGFRKSPGMPSQYPMCPEVQSLNGFICEKPKALPISLAKVPTLHRIAVGRNLELRLRYKGRPMLWPRELS